MSSTCEALCLEVLGISDPPRKVDGASGLRVSNRTPTWTPCLHFESMSTGRAYRARGRLSRSEQTRERIMAAVRELLAAGTFHESTVEQVADRAGIARATLYQHFRSRLDL